jgi:hypothetical protein
VLAAAAAGCGESESTSTAKEKPKWSEASEPPRAFATRTAKLLETSTTKKDCTELTAINNRSLARLQCPAPKSLSKSMAEFEVVGAKEYGSGAVVDYKSGEAPDGATITLYVAPDRNWAISRFGIITEPSTDTDDSDSRKGYDAVVDDYLDAVRERQCGIFRKVAFVGDAKGQDVCKTQFAATKGLAKLLNLNGSTVTLRYVGGNDTFGFYNLESQKPEPNNLTISVMRTDADRYVVLDLAISPTAAEQRRVRRQFEQQQAKQEKQRKQDEQNKQGKPDSTPQPGGGGTGRKVDAGA